MTTLRAVLLGFLLVATITIARSIFGLLRHVRRAHRSGIPYTVVPISSYNLLFVLLGPKVLNFLDRVLGPPSSETSWRWLVRGSWPWRRRYAPFAHMGSDTFLTVTPSGSILYTADADVISQILGRMSDFPKPTFLYKNVDIFGKNVVTTEGAAWRRHRKLVAPAFGEKNNRLVWAETIRQTRALLEAWSWEDTEPVTMAHRDCMKLSLNVIGKAGFGRDMGLATDSASEMAAIELPNDHVMTFVDSLSCLLKNIFPIVILPKWLLKRAPSAGLRKAYLSYTEFRRYMQEMLTEKKDEVRYILEPSKRSSMDLLRQLITAQDLDHGDDVSRTGKTGAKHPATPVGPRRLSDTEVLGNSFVLMFAGHETTAGTIHSLLTLLALNPASQRTLQECLDSIAAGTPIEDYDALLPKLQANPYIAAVVNEALRIQAPVPTIPKHVPVDSAPQPLMVNGREVSVPPGTTIKLCASCVQRNPKYWPHRTRSGAVDSKPKTRRARRTTDPEAYHSQSREDKKERDHWTSWLPSNPLNDLEAFRPERWLSGNSRRTTGPETRASAPILYSPPEGAFIPFSDGARVCLGRRFAQVEILAILATVFSQYSVELAVDSLTGTQLQVMDGMGKDERQRLWEVAAEKANRVWQENMSMVITLQLRGAHIPMRFVRRGEEMFH